MKRVFQLFCFLICFTSLSAQENQTKENTNVWNDLRHAWKSWWISHPTASLLDYGVFHYRKSFELKEIPKTFIIHVSADNRYNLYVNGTFICEGPVKSDFLHWNYESADISPYLHPAEHGFKSVEIKPHPGYLTHIKGVMPHSEGLIEVDLNFREGHVIGIVTLPDNLTGRFIWKEKPVLLKAGRQEINL